MRDGMVVTRDGLVVQPGFSRLPSVVCDTICFGAGDESKLDPRVKIRRRDPGVTATPCDTGQRGATLVGLSTGLSYTCRQCPCNAHRALCHRHGMPFPPMSRTFSLFVDHLLDNSPALLASFVEHNSVWNDEGWLAKWSHAKRCAIEHSSQQDPLLPDRVSMMVKRECGSDFPSRPRAIQYYPNMYTQARFGPSFYSLQKTYTGWFNRKEVSPGVRVTFASAMDAPAMGAWMSRVLADVDNPHFYERDGKNWDSTQQYEHFRVKMAAYKVAGEDLCDYVVRGMDVKGAAARSALRYKMPARVKSGHNDTTLGNSLSNAAIAVEAMVECGLRGDVIVAGDDLLIIIAGDFDADRLAQVEREYGIVPEYRKFRNVADVSFISAVWVPTKAGGYAFVPKAGRLLARLFWTCKPPSHRKVTGYRNGVVLGLRPSCGGLPVIGAFLDAHYTPGVVALRPEDKRSLAYTWVSDSAPIPRSELIDSFCKRYDLAETDVEACEDFLRGCRGQVGVVKHPVLDKILAVDLASLADRPLSSSL